MITVLYFLWSFVIGVISMAVLLAISRKTYFLMDKPDGDPLKIHKKNIPLVGGLAIVVASLIALVLFRVPAMGAIALCLAVISALGFYDDWKWKHITTIKPLLKFAFLIVCTFIPSVILSVAGISFNFLPIQVISIILGFIYIFGAINCINYQDGMDGLAGGLVSISLAGFLYLGLAANVPLAVAVSLIFLGAVTAFLQFNYPPAKVFMGDSGSYSLGLVLAVLAMLFSKPYDIWSVIGPVLIIGLPVIDGIFTNARRVAAGKSIFLGDRSHFYDKLLQKGFSTEKTLAICYSIQLAFVLVGVLTYK